MMWLGFLVKKNTPTISLQHPNIPIALKCPTNTATANWSAPGQVPMMHQHKNAVDGTANSKFQNNNLLHNNNQYQRYDMTHASYLTQCKATTTSDHMTNTYSNNATEYQTISKCRNTFVSGTV